MNENEKNRLEALAAADPHQFLYHVVRNSAFVDIEVMLGLKTRRSAEAKRFHLKRTWAVDPANDSLKVLFKRHAAGEHQSLRRALRSFTKEAPHKFEKLEKTLTPTGKIVPISLVDGDKVTPAELIESITEAVRLTRALSQRPQNLNWLLERCDFCEQVILPLLRKMPQEKSMAQYASPAAQKNPGPNN